VNLMMVLVRDAPTITLGTSASVSKANFRLVGARSFTGPIGQRPREEPMCRVAGC